MSRSFNRLISTMRFPILVRRHLYIELNWGPAYYRCVILSCQLLLWLVSTWSTVLKLMICVIILCSKYSVLVANLPYWSNMCSYFKPPVISLTLTFKFIQCLNWKIRLPRFELSRSADVCYVSQYILVLKTDLFASLILISDWFDHWACHRNIMGPLLLTWIKFNPCIDK